MTGQHSFYHQAVSLAQWATNLRRGSQANGNSVPQTPPAGVFPLLCYANVIGFLRHGAQTEFCWKKQEMGHLWSVVWCILHFDMQFIKDTFNHFRTFKSFILKWFKTNREVGRIVLPILIFPLADSSISSSLHIHKYLYYVYINIYSYYIYNIIKIFIYSPGWCGSVDWAPACKPKSHRFSSQSGHTPGLRARSPVGDVWEVTTHWCFSPSFSPSLPLCLKINT